MLNDYGRIEQLEKPGGVFEHMPVSDTFTRFESPAAQFSP